MNKILEALANGLLLADPRTAKQNAASLRGLNTIHELEIALKATLNDKEKDLLHRLEQAQIELEDAFAEDRFIHGFQLGALMMIEIFAGRDCLVSEELGE